MHIEYYMYRKVQDSLVDSHDSSIEKRVELQVGLQILADIRDRPKYTLKQTLISELMISSGLT